MWFGFSITIAVASASTCRSDSTPSWEFTHAMDAALKKRKKKKKENSAWDPYPGDEEDCVRSRRGTSACWLAP